MKELIHEREHKKLWLGVSVYQRQFVIKKFIKLANLENLILIVFVETSKNFHVDRSDNKCEVVIGRSKVSSCVIGNRNG